MNRRATARVAVLSFSLFAILFASATALTFKSSAAALYSESFGSYANGANPPNWYHDNGFAVENGWYQGNQTTPQGGWTAAFYTGQSFSDFSYSGFLQGLPNCNQIPPVLTLIFRVHDRTNLYGIWIDIDKFQLWKYVNGNPIVIQTLNLGGGSVAPYGFPYSISVTANGNQINASTIVNNQKYSLSAVDNSFSSGYVGVATYNCNAAFTNLIVSSFPLSTSTTSSVSTTPITTTTTSTTTATSTLSTTTTTHSSTSQITTTSVSSSSTTSSGGQTTTTPRSISLSPSTVALHSTTTVTATLSLSAPVNTIYSIVLVDPTGLSHDVFDGWVQSGQDTSPFIVSWTFTYNIAGTWRAGVNFAGGNPPSVLTSLLVQ